MPRVGIFFLLVLIACFSKHDCWLKPPTLRQDVHQYLATVHSTISPQNLNDIYPDLMTSTGISYKETNVRMPSVLAIFHLFIHLFI